MIPPPSPSNPLPNARAVNATSTPNSKANTAFSDSTAPIQPANNSAGTVADQFQSNLCRICTLIFDTDPIEIGRSKADPTICILCEAAMYIIEPKRITTMTATITLDEKEIAALIVDPQPLINDLRSLHNAWKTPEPKSKKTTAKKVKPAPYPVSKAKQAKPAKAIKPLLYCKHCGAQFITPGRHANHEANCIDNPANHKSAAEE